MEASGLQKLDGLTTTFSTRRNQPAVHIWDERQIPGEYMRQPTAPPQPDRVAIRAAILSGTAVAGAALIESRSVVRK
jgi:hypothetical protein